MAKTHRTNVPLKRHHWHSARTERRGRFARGWFWMEDQDLAYRRRMNGKRAGRAEHVLQGGVGYLTADKSHVRWLLRRHADRVPAERALWLANKLNLRGARV